MAWGGSRKIHCWQRRSSKSRSWLTSRPIPRNDVSASISSSRAVISIWLVGSSRRRTSGCCQRATAIWARLRSPWLSVGQRLTQSSPILSFPRSTHASASTVEIKSDSCAGTSSVRCGQKTICPDRLIVPCCTCRCPAASCRKVVFPAPFGPTIPVHPSARWTVMSSSNEDIALS